MVLHSRTHFTVCALLVVVSSSAYLRDQPLAKAAPAKVDSKVKAVAPKAKAQSEAETLAALGKGLQTIHNLQAMFTKKGAEGPADGAEKFANGALSEELSRKDSQVWSTIDNMIGATQKAMTSIKGKSKADREKVMASLEGELDKKASVLSNVTDDVSKKQQQQDEEYLLGLLILHQKDWSMDKQLNATQTFMKNSPLLQNFFKHHDANKALAPQLAALMDARKGQPKVAAEVALKVAPEVAALAKVAKAAPATAKDTKKKAVGKAASSAARALFIQLASTFRNRDCPYCAAQCVDKCHTAGKPYVTCLTDCADAGK